MHECDILVIRNSGYAIEIEIKRSKQDLKNDFKKRHGHRSNKIKEFYYAIPFQHLSWEELIPKRCGILTYRRWKSGWVVASLHRKPEKNKNCRKLTHEEMLKAAKLGCMRIWSLKKRIYKMY